MPGYDIAFAARCLREGHLVAIPTETVYGLAGNAYNEEAVKKIFQVKNRPFYDPLIVHVSSEALMNEVVEEVPPLAKKLTELFWPGPLTILLPKSAKISPLITAGSPLVALRMPNHPLTLELLGSLDFPLVAPSANPFGYISPTTAAHVDKQLGTKVAYILEGGPCPIGIESTIIGFEGDRIVLYRQGAISEEALRAHAPLTFKNKGPAPGLLKSHYAPRKQLLLGSIDELLDQHNNVAVLSFQKTFSHPSISAQKILSPMGNLDEAATNLFAFLRFLDEQPVSLILAEKVPHQGIGRAINDRLEKAAAKKEPFL